MVIIDFVKNTFYFICRCLDDNDDEVRDRATLYLKLMVDESGAEKYVKDGELLNFMHLYRCIQLQLYFLNIYRFYLFACCAWKTIGTIRKQSRVGRKTVRFVIYSQDH